MSKSLWRFVTTGGISAGCYFVLAFILQKVFAIPPWSAAGLAYLFTFFGTYTVQRLWTFSSIVTHKKSLPRYAFTQAASLLITISVMRVFELVFPNSSAYAASAVTTVFAGAASFFLSSKWVFTVGTQGTQ
ncbi:MAG: hypothetical protein CBHOC_2746 [uncultured Caballeronia sp.]|nr:MAG: hypothetical protein CBHOC_2746 [uncultured Caballeronia sp.]